MNTAIPAIRSSDSEPLCPLDERRTKTELLVKLFVVHFTTLSAFFHLLNIRGEYILSPRPIFYICAPLSFIAQHVVAAAALILRIPLVCIRDRRFPNSETDLVHPVKWLLAKLKVGSTELGSRQSTNGRHRLGERATRGLGHVLVTTVFIVQCSVSLLLYHRRKMHAPDSIALIDEKIFELAASGTLVGLLTLGVTLRFPGFRILNAAQGPRSKIEKIMICLGHRRAPTVCPRQQTIFGDWQIMSPVTCFVALSITSCVVLHAAGKVNPFQELQCIYNFFKSAGTHKCREDQVREDQVLELLVVLPFLLSFMVGCFAGCFIAMFCTVFPIESFHNRLIQGDLASFSRYSKWVDRMEALLWITVGVPLSLIAGIFFFFVFFYPVYLITGVIPTLLVGVADYSGIFTQLNEWQNWPVDVPCPVLWKDPMADLVWWLA